MKLNILIMLVLMAISAHGQQITVIDKVTAQPVTNAAIYSESPSISTITDSKGHADITVFKGVEKIIIKHVVYKQRITSYNELAAQKTISLDIDNISLNEVTISANRWEQQNREVPYRIEKTTQREVMISNTQTAADMLGAGGFAYIQKSQLAGGSPILRGFATNRVLLVVDGVRMNNAIFRTGNVQNVISLDALAMQSNEILFGPGAVIYGSDAIGGVMDFHTLDPMIAQGGKTTTSGNVITRYSSANNEFTGHLNFNIGLNKWAFRTAITYSDYDDLKAGKNGNAYFLRPFYQTTINGRDTVVANPNPQKQIASGYNQMNVLQRIKYVPDSRHEIDYGFYYSETSDAPRYDRLNLTNDDGTFANAQWYYGPQKWMMNRISTKFSKYNTFFNDMNIEVAHQLYQESRHDRKMNNPRLRNQYEKVNALSVNLDFDKKLNKNLTLFYGIENIYNKVNSTANRININSNQETPTNTRYPDGSTWNSTAAYGNLKYNLSPKWIINTGARYSYITINADFDTSLLKLPFVNAKLNNGALNGSVGIVWLKDKSTQIYTNLSTGFRSPNIDDIGKVFDSKPGAVVVPNPDLEPEYAYNAEIGTAFIRNDILKVNLSIYYTYLDKALALRDFSYYGKDSIQFEDSKSKVFAIQNLNQAYVYGLQLGVEIVPVKGIRLTSKLSFQHGEEQDDKTLEYYPLRHAAPLFGTTHLIIEKHRLFIDIYANYNSGMDSDQLPVAENNDYSSYAKDNDGLPFVPGWYTLNLKTSFVINRNLTFNAGVENITNQLYRPFASGISASGINFIGSIKVSF